MVSIQLAILGMLMILIAWAGWSLRRSANDVLEDLNQFEDIPLSGGDCHLRSVGGIYLDSPLASAGLLNRAECQRFERHCHLVPLLGVALGLFSSLIIGIDDLFFGASLALLGGCAGFFVSRTMPARRRHQYHERLSYFLPIVMERLLMGVQAGLDIVAALTRITEIQADISKYHRGVALHQDLDPVSRLLKIVLQLTERGMLFEEALGIVARTTLSSPIRHSFVHLALAHREGGELSMPLRELSDATQIYYQETIETEIAKLPVKATAPLALVFCGLLMFFVTAPLIEVLNQMELPRMPSGMVKHELR